MDLTNAFRRIVWAALGILRPSDDPARDSSPVVQIDRLALYRCRVVSCAADGSTVDLQPDNPRIEPRQAVPVVVGVPGMVAIVEPGSIVWLGWEAGDDSKPRAVPDWETASVTKLVANAVAVHLAGESGSDGVATKKDLQFLLAAITSATPTPNDGGAAFKAALILALQGGGWTDAVSDGHFCSGKVKAQR